MLFVAESSGRREVLRETLAGYNIKTSSINSWQEYLENLAELTLAVAPLEQGVWLPDQSIVLITETQLLG